MELIGEYDKRRSLGLFLQEKMNCCRDSRGDFFVLSFWHGQFLPLWGSKFLPVILPYLIFSFPLQRERGYWMELDKFYKEQYR